MPPLYLSLEIFRLFFTDQHSWSSFNRSAGGLTSKISDMARLRHQASKIGLDLSTVLLNEVEPITHRIERMLEVRQGRLRASAEQVGERMAFVVKGEAARWLCQSPMSSDLPAEDL
jgi:hypothetical protein